jgi:transcriptional antiterminator NusG
MSTEPTDTDTAASGSPDDMQWYVLKVQSNREKSIRDSLLRRIKMEGLEADFGDVVIPTEKVVETKGGKRKVREQKLFPGYMMIRMRLTDETWYLVLGTGGVGDFTGAGGKPMPMPESEVKRLLGQETVTEISEDGVETTATSSPSAKTTKEPVPVFRFSVSVGEAVKVKEGPFENFEGNVHSLDDHTGKIKVMIEIFGRSTEVELEHWQVEKV